jgi:hypothetical protein
VEKTPKGSLQSRDPRKGNTEPEEPTSWESSEPGLPEPGRTQQMTDRPVQVQAREAGAAPREGGNLASISLATGQVETANTYSRSANLGRKRGKRWEDGSPRARGEMCNLTIRGRHCQGLMKLPRPGLEPPLPREVGVNRE